MARALPGLRGLEQLRRGRPRSPHPHRRRPRGPRPPAGPRRRAPGAPGGRHPGRGGARARPACRSSTASSAGASSPAPSSSSAAIPASARAPCCSRRRLTSPAAGRGALRLGRGVGAPGAPTGRAPDRRGRPCRTDLYVLAETSLDAVLAQVEALDPGAADRRLGADGVPGRAGLVAGERDPAAGVRPAPDGRGQVPAPARCSWWGTSPRKATSPGRARLSTSWIACSTWKGSASTPTACCGRRRTASGRPTRSASSRWRRTGCARCPIRRPRS